MLKYLICRKSILTFSITVFLLSKSALATALWPAKGDSTPKVFSLMNQRMSDSEYFELHDGVDIPALVQNPSEGVVAGNAIQLPITMKYRGTAGPPEGDNYFVDFEVVIEDKTYYCAFGHLWNLTPFTTGQTVTAGTIIGYISNYFPSYTNIPDHLHIDVSTTSYVDDTKKSVAESINPLVFYDFDSAYKDPQGAYPCVTDRSNPVSPWDTDSEPLQFMTGSSYVTDQISGTDTWLIRGNIDAVAEVLDQMNYSAWYPCAYKTGYEIIQEIVYNGHNVGEHILFEQDKMAVENPSGSVYNSKVDSLYETVNKDVTYATAENNFHYVLTNTKGNDGSVANLDADQYWNTNSSGAGTYGNGSDATDATKAQDAYYPDGIYCFFAYTWDLINWNYSTYYVYVENFLPAVVRYDPDPGETGVNVAAGVVIQFSETMNTTATSSAVTLRKASDYSIVAVDKIWNPGKNALSVIPSSNLEYCTEYIVEIFSYYVKDLYGWDGSGHNGVPLDSEYDSYCHDGSYSGYYDDVVWTFTTQAAP